MALDAFLGGFDDDYDRCRHRRAADGNSTATARRKRKLIDVGGPRRDGRRMATIGGRAERFTERIGAGRRFVLSRHDFLTSDMLPCPIGSTATLMMIRIRHYTQHPRKEEETAGAAIAPRGKRIL